MIGFGPIATKPIGANSGGVILVSADLAANYAIAALVSADLAADYSITAFVSADLAASYSVGVLVGANLTATYAIAAATGLPMSFTPSVARRIKVGASTRAFSTTLPGYWDLTNPKKPKGLKDPSAQLDVTFDWSDWLTDCADTIAAVEWVLGGTLQNEGAALATALATIFVSGGVTGEAEVTCRITTNSTPPRIEDRTVFLLIENR